MTLTLNGARMVIKKDISDDNNRILTRVASRAVLDDKILFYEDIVVDYNSHNLELIMEDYNLFEENVQGKWNYGTMVENGLNDFEKLLSFTKDVSEIDYFKESIKINLCGQNFNPYILGTLLERIGYSIADDALVDYTNGWENDFWIDYLLDESNDSLPSKVTIFGSLMTFELALSIY